MNVCHLLTLCCLQLSSGRSAHLTVGARSSRSATVPVWIGDERIHTRRTNSRVEVRLREDIIKEALSGFSDNGAITVRTLDPSTTPASDSPTAVPSDKPSSIPTFMPSDAPSDIPSFSPSDVPSDFPSATPSISPSFRPSAAPTISSTEISSSGSEASQVTTVAGFTAAGAFIILAGLVIGRRYRSESPPVRPSSSSFPRHDNDEDDGIDLAIIEGPQPSDITGSEPRTPRFGSDTGDKYDSENHFSPRSEEGEGISQQPIDRYNGPQPFSPDSKQHRAISTLIHAQADPVANQGFQPYSDEEDGFASKCGSCPEDASTVRFRHSLAEMRSTQSI